MQFTEPSKPLLQTNISLVGGTATKPLLSKCWSNFLGDQHFSNTSGKLLNLMVHDHLPGKQAEAMSGDVWLWNMNIEGPTNVKLASSPTFLKRRCSTH